MVFSARELILHHLNLRNHHRDILRSDELSNPYLGIFEPKFFGEFLPIWFWDVFLHLKPLLQTWLHRSSWSIPIALHWNFREKKWCLIWLHSKTQKLAWFWPFLWKSENTARLNMPRRGFPIKNNIYSIKGQNGPTHFMHLLLLLFIEFIATII